MNIFDFTSLIIKKNCVSKISNAHCTTINVSTCVGLDKTACVVLQFPVWLVLSLVATLEEEGFLCWYWPFLCNCFPVCLSVG